MKKIKFVIVLVIPVFFYACASTHDDYLHLHSDQELKLKANQGPGLGNMNSPWVDGDSIGLYVRPNGTPAFSQLLESNRKYYYNSTLSTFELQGKPIYYPQSANVDLIAYAPFKSGIVSNYPVNVSNQSNLKTIDLLYSNASKNLNKQSGAVSLVLDHQLSKVIFNLINSNGTTGLELMNIAMEGFYDQASFDLTTGVLSDHQVSASPISIGLAREAIVIPNTNLASKKFNFTKDGVNYEYTLPTSDSFEHGKIYNYQITINNKNITVSLSDITPWTINSQTAQEGVISNRPIEYAYIPAGTFLMGAPDTASIHNIIELSNYRQHWVRISKSFFMSKNEITIGQYTEFLNATGVQKTAVSEIRHDINGESIHLFSLSPTRTLYFENNQWLVESGLENYPMSLVTWAGALAYAQWKGATLPTEAQWEYAYRAGTKTKFFTGNFASEMMSYGNFYNNENGDVQPVGQKRPNPWGLNDIAGNLLEWCLDGPSGNVLTPYPTANNELMPLIDPVEPIRTSTFAYYRGGSSAGSVQNATAYNRYTQSKNRSAPQIGFRIVINP